MLKKIKIKKVNQSRKQKHKTKIKDSRKSYRSLILKNPLARGNFIVWILEECDVHVGKL